MVSKGYSNHIDVIEAVSQTLPPPNFLQVGIIVAPTCLDNQFQLGQESYFEPNNLMHNFMPELTKGSKWL